MIMMIMIAVPKLSCILAITGGSMSIPNVSRSIFCDSTVLISSDCCSCCRRCFDGDDDDLIVPFGTDLDRCPQDFIVIITLLLLLLVLLLMLIMLLKMLTAIDN